MMLYGKKIVVVMPAYNAEKTVQITYDNVNQEIVDEIILVDDNSKDSTVSVAKKIGIKTYVHATNLGYGANQKTCYQQALKSQGDVVIMVHPDYQYEPKLVPAMASMVASGIYDCALASRILGGGALAGGMPVYKYISNRILTFFQNILMGQKVSEYHTGFRVFSREVLETLPLAENSNDFVFDNQMLSQTVAFGFKIGEISCPTKYFEEASSINLQRSIKYGLGVLAVSIEHFLHKKGILKSAYLDQSGRKISAYERPIIDLKSS